MEKDKVETAAAKKATAAEKAAAKKAAAAEKLAAAASAAASAAALAAGTSATTTEAKPPPGAASGTPNKTTLKRKKGPGAEEDEEWEEKVNRLIKIIKMTPNNSPPFQLKKKDEEIEDLKDEVKESTNDNNINDDKTDVSLQISDLKAKLQQEQERAKSEEENAEFYSSAAKGLETKTEEQSREIEEYRQLSVGFKESMREAKETIVGLERKVTDLEAKVEAEKAKNKGKEETEEDKKAAQRAEERREVENLIRCVKQLNKYIDLKLNINVCSGGDGAVAAAGEVVDLPLQQQQDARAAAQLPEDPPAAEVADEAPIMIGDLRNCWYLRSECPQGQQCPRIHLPYGKYILNNEKNLVNDNINSRGVEESPPRDGRGAAASQTAGAAATSPAAAATTGTKKALHPGTESQPRGPRSGAEPRRQRRREERDRPEESFRVRPQVATAAVSQSPKTENKSFIKTSPVSFSLDHDWVSNRLKLRNIGRAQDIESREIRHKELDSIVRLMKELQLKNSIHRYNRDRVNRQKSLLEIKEYIDLRKKEDVYMPKVIANNKRQIQSVRRKLEILNAQIKSAKQKIKCADKKHNPKQGNKTKTKTVKSSLKVYSCNTRSLNNKISSIRNIIDTGCADIYFLSEINTKAVTSFKGHHNFTCYSNKKFHGITAICANHLKGDLLRIPHEDSLEIVHILYKKSEPMTHIVGVYLDVESRTSVTQTAATWNKLTNIFKDILSKGEILLAIGDMNRPIDKSKPSHGTKLLHEFLKESTVEMINNPSEPTRIDPATKMGSVLDLCLISKNITKSTKPLKVDTNRSVTPFSLSKAKGVITPKYTDHLAIIAEIELQCKVKKKMEKIAVINYSNKEGWKKYRELSDEYAEKIKDIVMQNDDADIMEQKIRYTDIDLQIKSFGITWKGGSKKKKGKSSKDIKDIYLEQQKELNDMIEEGIRGDDLNKKMYKMRDLIEGPKIKPQEPMAINDPNTEELITDSDEIKRVSLEHNIKILTKNALRPQDEEKFQRIRAAHDRIMNSPDTDEWELEKPMFNKVSEKIKVKNKKLFNLYNKAGNEYKDAIFEFMAKLIRTEKIPKCFLDTSLTQIWKKKGSALSLNNMRFIHMRHWYSKLLDALITEKMKENIVQATPNIQLGGMPGASCVDHLIVVKTWMKYKEESKKGGILCTYDMSKFFDKEPLCDIMHVLDKWAKIGGKCYRTWYRLNENTRISVKTSVGESKSAVCPDTIGQGGAGSALASSCSIGTAIYETFKEEFSTMLGKLGLNCLIFQDDIGKLNDNMDEVREGCDKIDETLKSKRLSLNYDKSKYVIIGGTKARKEILEQAKINPLTMGGVIIANAIMEKYLGDIIHELGCARSIQETIKERIGKLIATAEEIIKTSENPWMGGLNNSETPFKLFEARIIPALLNNCESWIDIKESHIKDLQDFQDEFIRRVLHLPPQTTKAIIYWDIGMMPMKWRIAGKKLQYVRKLQLKEDENLTKRALIEEVNLGIKGLAHECKEITDELGLQNIMNGNTPKSLIKRTIAKKIKEESWSAMENSKKVRDRLTFNPADNTYIKCLPLPLTRVWFRYRARAIPKVKGNHKQSHSDLSCTLCNSKEEMNQEHLETCEGTEYERRGLDMGTWRGLLDFWRRMMKKLEATVA